MQSSKTSSGLDQTKFFEHDDGTATPFKARHSHFSGRNSEGHAYESLPIGNYTAVADEPPAEDSDEYGTFYISTNDPTGRGRDIHGGGSGLDDVLAVCAVIDVPLRLGPLIVARGNLRRDVGNNLVFAAELLAELNGVHRTVLNALTAGNAFFLIDLGNKV